MLPDPDDYSGKYELFPLLGNELAGAKKYVLKHSVLKLNVSVAPTHFKYFRETCSLVVGDRKGFITRYDLSELVRAVGLKPVEPNIKTKTALHQNEVVVDGFVAQSLDPDYVRSMAINSRQPLIKKRFCANCFDCEIDDIVALHHECFLLVSKKMEVQCYALSGKLLGNIARSELQRAPQAI